MTPAGPTGTMAWRSVGDESARPLVMVHALGADSGMWESQITELSRVRRLVLIDLPGHGRSAAAPGPYTIPDLGRALLDVASSAGAELFDLCGVSLGGLISLWMAAHATERVMTLVVSNTAARIGTKEVWQARIEAVRQGGMAAVADQALGRFFNQYFAEANPGEIARTEQVLLDTDPEAYAACCEALRDADVSESVPAIICPTLIVGGGQDLSTPPENSFWLHQHVHGSQLVILDGAPHFANVEQPGEWTAVARKFLAGQSDRRT